MAAPPQPRDPGLLPPVPRVPWEPEASRAAILAVACETCSAVPGQDCDGSTYSWFILGYYLRGLDGIHAARYRPHVTDVTLADG